MEVHWSSQISVFMKYMKSILFFLLLTRGAVSDTFFRECIYSCLVRFLRT